MNVKVNRSHIEIFEGALAKHAVLQYLSRRKIKPSKLTECHVFDSHGHVIGLDAPLTEGQTIKLKFL